MSKQSDKNIQKKLLKQIYEYACGKNVEKNLEKALGLFLEAGKSIANTDFAQMVLTVFRKKEDILCNLILEGTKKNDAFSFYMLTMFPPEYFEKYDLPRLSYYELMDKAAEYGDAEMKLFVGRIYLDGLNFESSLKENVKMNDTAVKAKAIDYIRQAAIMGHTQAQYQYFTLCESKQIENGDICEGRKLCLQAAESGHREAQYAIGSLLLTGDKYLQKNQAEGVDWLKKSAKQGNTDAMIALGDFCIKSHDNFNNTVVWYEKAAEKGDSRANVILILLGAHDYDLYADGIASKLVKMSREDPLASKLVEYLIANPDFSKEHGVEISRDLKSGAITIKHVNYLEDYLDDYFESAPNEEVSKLIKSAENEDIDAMIALGNHYYESEDLSRACIWFAKAAEKGDARGKCYLNICGDSHCDLYEIAKDLIDKSVQGDRFATELVDFLISNPSISATMGAVLLKDAKTNQIIYRKPNETDKFDELIPEPSSEDIYDCRFTVVKLFGHTVIYDDTRINRDVLPAGYYCYDVRHGDNDYKPCHIKERVMVNHMGLIISNRPLKLDEEGYRFINRRKREWKYTDESMTLREYMTAFPPSETEF